MNNNNCEVIEAYSEYVKVKNPEVSVFMLTYNREKYLQLAIESFFEQTYNFAPLILLDNMSTDNTEEYAGTISNENFFYVRRKSEDDFTNTQFAFQHCQTPYLLVLHDDDILKPGFLLTLLEFMKANPNISVATLSADIINEKGHVIGAIRRSSETLLFKGHEYFDIFFKRDKISPIYPTAIYRKSFYNEYRKYMSLIEAGPSHDQMTWFQTERFGGTIAILPDVLFQYRHHASQTSSSCAGFIDLKLIDYLYTDEYYSRMMLSKSHDVNHRLWSIFKTLSKKYYEGQITSSEYRSFFDYSFIKMNSSEYKYLSICRLCFGLRKALRSLYGVVYGKK